MEAPIPVYGPAITDANDLAKAIEKEAIRDPQIENLFAITDLILDELTPVDKEGHGLIHQTREQVNLDLSNAVSGTLATVFTYLRKEKNKEGSASEMLNYTSVIGNKTIAMNAFLPLVKAKNLDIDFQIATPLMNILCAFKLAFDEIRTGTTKVALREESMKRQGIKRTNTGEAKMKKDDKNRFINVSAYGLNNQHCALLQGITFPPTRRTGLLRSLGPLTQSIALVNENQYTDKVRTALNSSLKMLPMHAELTMFLKDASLPGSVSGVMKELGDLLLLTTARSTQKIYIPLLLAHRIWKHRSVGVWSSAGPRMMFFISNAMRGQGLIFVMKTADPTNMSQMVFHAIYGTYLEDLSILPQVTNQNRWVLRKDADQVFKKRSTQRLHSFEPIHFIRASKMATSMLANAIGNIEPMAIGRPAFAGSRVRHFSEELRTYLRTGKASISYSTDPVQLQFAIKKLKDEVVKAIEEAEGANIGTTPWYILDNGVMVETDFRAIESGIYFYGAN